ncbi:hypothetical protein GCK72_020516 [Caenorhabditis remanei]|uniref:Seven TM Receptor n=1 Tax=Caenorhabditis remanei TaxID=31234 RepID=A0A6A5GHP7_CAERE|nr:hypothetical protein GCK72_020516 [Caenorhabditis remanei]KAF1753959.1 hypothetical protein GCK72_020516 [Caenorhabditis remanei]
MVVYFAVIGILFAGLEVIGRPFAHNFNGSLIFFSSSKLGVPHELLLLSISIWGGFYSLIIAFIAVQFVYRYLSLFGTKSAKKFDGYGTIVWGLYPIIPGAIYTYAFHIFCIPNDYTDGYMRNEILSTYEFNISEVPRFIMVPYDSDGHLRIESLKNISVDLFLVCSHYLIIIYCGLGMHFNMKKELEKFSVPQQKLQRQFFKALVIQSLGPTIFLVLPAAPVLLTPVVAPLLGMEVHWKTGWLFSLIGLFPPFDSVAFMLIVTEYKKIIKTKFLKKVPDVPIDPSTTALTTPMAVVWRIPGSFDYCIFIEK